MSYEGRRVHGLVALRHWMGTSATGVPIGKSASCDEPVPPAARDEYLATTGQSALPPAVTGARAIRYRSREVSAHLYMMTVH